MISALKERYEMKKSARLMFSKLLAFNCRRKRIGLRVDGEVRRKSSQQGGCAIILKFCYICIIIVMLN